MALDPKRVHYLELFIASILFVSANYYASFASFLSETVLLLELLFAVLFLAYASAFAVFSSRLSRYSAYLHLAFVGMLVSYLYMLAFDGRLSAVLAFSLLKRLDTLALFLVLFMPVFLAASFGTYFIRKRKKWAVLLIAAAFALLLLYYSFRVVVERYTIDDEMLLTLESTRALLNGTNPYTVSIAPLLVRNYSNLVLSSTTNNRVLGTMDYPSLFFLSFLPFYFLSQPTPQNLASVDAPAQAGIFIFFMLLAFTFSLEKDDLIKPKPTLFIFFVFALLYTSSTVTFLTLALLLFAYTKLESRYAWLILGLAVSIHEELWLPVLFLLIYSFNNQGARAGMRNLLGAGAVFLLFNSYFIATAPAAYFREVFSPLNALLLPNGSSPMGFFLLKHFPVLLATYQQVFVVSVLIFALLLLYLNRKELIPIFSIVPFLLLDHSLPVYYATFLFVFIFATATSKWKKKQGKIEKLLRRNGRFVLVSLSALVLVILGLLYFSHLAYTRQFNLTASNAVLIVDAANKTNVYKVQIHYSNLSNGTIYVYAIMYGNLSLSERGLVNDTIVGAGAACGGDYQCLVNTNRIVLPGNSNTYNLTARIRWSSSSLLATNVGMEIYNNQYYHVGGSAYNASR